MTQQEFLEAVPLYRAAWVRKVRNRLTSRAASGVSETAEDIVQQAIGELTAFDTERGRFRYEGLAGPADITQRIEYRLRDYMDHTPLEKVLQTEEGDDSEAYRFIRGKATVQWVMGSTEVYQRQVDIRGALAALPHRHRYVAAMVLVEGHTQAEVAVRLDVSQVMVCKILEEAKSQLCTALSHYGGL